MRRPSAFLPLAMSLAAIALVVWFVATFGVVRQPHDEGAAARLFQLLIATQVPIVAWFALTWLPRAPRPATLVLALQGCAALVAIALVVMLER
jgi:hypothetical protein